MIDYLLFEGISAVFQPFHMETSLVLVLQFAGDGMHPSTLIVFEQDEMFSHACCDIETLFFLSQQIGINAVFRRLVRMQEVLN